MGNPGKSPIRPNPAGSLTTALQPRLSPVKLLALRAGSPTEARMAVALPRELEWEQDRGQSPNQRLSPQDLRQTASPIYPGIHRRIPYLVAGGASGSTWVAGTGLAAVTTGKIPEVGGTAVTAKALDIGQARALPAAWVTVAPVSGWALAGIRAQQVACAACDSHNEHSDQGKPEQWTPTPAIPLVPHSR